MNLDIEASEVLDQIMGKYDSYYGAGSMSTTVYDTAWVSMISKSVNGKQEWLFSSSFQYILDTQKPSGGWDSYSSDIDGILNTAASLLSLHKHLENPYQLGKEITSKLRPRILRAKSYLQKILAGWDISATRHVGFEILVPSLLEQLDNLGDFFAFDQRESLMKVRSAKLAKLDPQFFYSNKRTSALHSLEGFVGNIDFDKVSHHKVFGSMMCSPSATAAYMIHSTNWDLGSEAYIRHVLKSGAGNGNGSVPSAFPSHFFEMSWAVTTLLDGGFEVSTLGPSLQKAKEILKQGFEGGSGVIGFAPCIEPDADDSAKGIIAMSLLGESMSKDTLVQKFGEGEWFKTYRQERNMSFSTNCNVLNALILPVGGLTSDTAQKPQHTGQIKKVIELLSRSWLNKPDMIQDKWNLSTQYTTMLVSQAFMRVLNVWADNEGFPLELEFMNEKVLVVLFQAVVRTLQSQLTDGSWNTSPEITAYSILTVNMLSFLPICQPLEIQIKSSLAKAKSFLREARSTKNEFIWTEKVSYRSHTVSNAYILAALNVVPSPYVATKRTSTLFHGFPADVERSVHFFEKLPMFSSTPKWQLQAAILEGLMYSKPLGNSSREIFMRKSDGETKHLAFIPFTWTGANNALDSPLGYDQMKEMMAISAVAYQVDQVMESDVASLTEEEWGLLKAAVIDMTKIENSQVSNGHEEILNNISRKRKRCFVDSQNNTCSNDGSIIAQDGKKIERHEKYKQIVEKLQRLITHYLKNNYVQTASTYDQTQLRIELKNYLLAHIIQIKDNRALKSQTKLDPHGKKTFETARTSFFNWVRTVSSNHTAGPFAFSFFLCLIGKGDGGDCLKSVQAKYVAQDVCRHLSTLCRLYNDYGSMVRDQEEDNLNCIQFPEFSRDISGAAQEGLKSQLMEVAGYEKRCLDHSLADLEKIVDDEVFKPIQVFCHTTNMYGQMYILKDMTPSLRT